MQVAGDNAYAGWFHEVSADGSAAFRLGFEDVVGETNFGIGNTTLTQPQGMYRHGGQGPSKAEG